jgi:class 3 adenylate cyclase
LLSAGSEPSPPTIVRAGRNVVSITNDFDREIVVRLERSIPQQDVITAAQASSLPMFRKLFPQESPQLGTLINVSTVTLLAVELFDADRLHDTLEDAESFTCMKWFHDQVAHFADASGASIIKVMGTETLSTFENRFDIVNFVAGLDQQLREHPRGLRLRAAAHCGTALATSGSDRLEYFGRSVHHVRRMLQRSGANELWMTEAFAADPLVAQAIGQRGFSTSVLDLPGVGQVGVRCHRVDLR